MISDELILAGKVFWVSFPNRKGQVIRTTFSFNVWRNIVALQVERVVAPITTACSTCHRTNFSVTSCSNMLRKVDPSSTFCKQFFQLATLKFVPWQVEHAVVIRATTRSTCNAIMLRHNVERKCCPYYLALMLIGES